MKKTAGDRLENPRELKNMDFYAVLDENNEDKFNSFDCYSLFVIEPRIPIRVLIKFAPFSLPSGRLQTTPALKHEIGGDNYFSTVPHLPLLDQ